MKITFFYEEISRTGSKNSDNKKNMNFTPKMTKLGQVVEVRAR